MKNIYNEIENYRKKYPLTLAFRTKKHCKIIEKHLNDDEVIQYAFCGQKNSSPIMFISSCVVALTNKRIVIGQKRALWGYFFTSITPDMYNDIKVSKGLIWSNVEIDTIKENVYISHLDPNAAIEIENNISEFMMEEKQKYGKKDN